MRTHQEKVVIQSYKKNVASSRLPVSAKDVTIGIGIDQVDYRFQPMVEPRYLSIRIDGYVEGE